MGKCKFSSTWLSRRSDDGVLNSQWLTEGDSTNAYCSICSASINVTRGYQAVEAHMKTGKHKKNLSAKLSESQQQIQVVPGKELVSLPSVSSASGVSTLNVRADVSTSQQYAGGAFSLELVCRRDATTRAEILWVLKVVMSNYSFRSCDDTTLLFKSMFPSSVDILHTMTLNRTKASYYATQAIGPYFYRLLTKDVVECGSYYTLFYDETRNSENKKELQIAIRYWSNSHNQVIISHLETLFLGSADAKTLKDSILLAIHRANLPLKKLLMLGSDGPNVNKAVFKLMNEEVKLVRSQSLLNIGTCFIHKVHNAFLKGLDEFGHQTADFVIALHNFIHKYPNREEDFVQIQIKLKLPTVKIPKHASVRWLSLKSCLQIIIKQIPAIEEYFLVFIPKSRKNIAETKLYGMISTFLKEKFYKVELKFLLSMCQIFTRFTENFQSSSEILIHILYEEVRKLYITMVNRVHKHSSVIIKFDMVMKELLPVNEVIVPQDIKDEMSKVKSTEKDRLKVLHMIQKHYLAAARYLYDKCLPEIKSLKGLRFLAPHNVKSESFLKDVEASSMLLLLSDIDNTVLQDECLMLKLEVDGMLEKSKSMLEFWKQVFGLKYNTGSIKYPNLSALVQGCFTLSHGNADVERGFSISANVLDEGKTTMSVELLNALLNIRSGMKLYDNKPHKFVVNNDLIKLARQANCSYRIDCEEKRKRREEKLEEEKKKEKRKREEEKKKEEVSVKKKRLDMYETELKELTAELNSKRKVREELFQVGNKRLKKATKLEDVKVAQNILQGVESASTDEQELSKRVDELQKRVNHIKDDMIKQSCAK